MGMTIDEAIHDTEVMKEYLECRGEIRSEGLGAAIEIMRKYQQIEEIYERFQKDGGYYPLHMAWLDVMEVVEDGKID